MIKKAAADQKKSSPPYLPWVVALAFLTVLIVAFFVFDFRHKNTALPPPAVVPSGPAASSKDALNTQLVDVTGKNDSINDVIKKLGKHIYLPTGQVTVTTVVDPEALRKENSVFYQFAKKGDRVVIYPSQAILYDPVLDIVLDVVHFAPAAPDTKK